MHVFIFVIALLFVSMSLMSQQNAPLEINMDFEAYDPPSTLVVPEHPITRAKYPFVDVHSHHWDMQKADLSKLVREMDELNMAVNVNLSGRGGRILQGMTQSIDSQKYASRLVVFTNIELRSIDESDWVENTLAQLEHDVHAGAKGLKLYKSQGMFNKDSSGNRIPLNHLKLDAVWRKCAALRIPVLIHAADPKPFWEPLDSLNERWLELKLRPGRKRNNEDPAPWSTIIGEQHDVIRRHPNTIFINAHFGWFAHHLDTLSMLLDEMPNMYIEFGAVIAELGRQPRQAKAFFTRYQNRILFGKDAYVPEEYHTYFRVLETADEYFPYYKRYHAFWRMYGLQLEDEVLRKIYYQNALRIIPGLDPSLFPG